MKRLKKLLDAWYDGYKIKGIQTPPFATICELEDIYSGIEKTTVNSTVIRFLNLCGIKYHKSGIGWEIEE